MKIILMSLLLLIGINAQADNVHIQWPINYLQNHELAIIVNDSDPLSQRIAAYYQQQRNIPDSNIIRVKFNSRRSTIPVDEFIRLKQEVDKKTPSHIQAYVLTWAEPYRVGCMSITTAFASGYDKKWCSSQRCAQTQTSPYFNSPSIKPYDHYRLRPTMSLAATNFAQAKALIDRGMNSANILTSGTAYLVNTSDTSRNVRSVFFPMIEDNFSSWINIESINSEGIQDKDDVMFYFTGLTHIPYLDTLSFLPGAVADHLTSSGGKLTHSRQMSSLRWLEAGATGSYGTVVEPCNLLQKFPNPLIMMSHYLRGETLIEAYWKSVAQPGEGIFIGEPLARPFGGYRVTKNFQTNQWYVETYVLAPGSYQIHRAYSPIGPYHPDKELLQIKPMQSGFYLPASQQQYLRIISKYPSIHLH